VERYIKLSQLYEAGMEMNTPRYACSLPCLPLCTRYHKACCITARMTGRHDRVLARVSRHTRVAPTIRSDSVTRIARAHGLPAPPPPPPLTLRRRSATRNINLNLTRSHDFHDTSINVESPWWIVGFMPFGESELTSAKLMVPRHSYFTL